MQNYVIINQFNTHFHDSANVFTSAGNAVLRGVKSSLTSPLYFPQSPEVNPLSRTDGIMFIP